ncbi:MAG: LptF/LptG family permease [Alphaproteobacteria bacterium]
MQRISFYIFRQLMIALIFAAAAVSFVVLFTQSFRLLSLVIDNSSTLWIFLELMLLAVPTFMPLVLPLSVGLATIFIYNKLAVDSELVIMRAAGMSPMRLALPAILVGTIVMVACYMCTLYLTPAANRAMVAVQYEVRNNYAVFLSRPGNFNDITAGLTFYAQKRNGQALEGILIHDVRIPKAPITLMAKTGQVIEKDGGPQIVVFNGKRQEMDVTTGRLNELAFDQYVLDLNALRSAESSRLPDPREQTAFELLNPSDDMLKMRASRERLIAELHQRLASPLLALSFTLIGLAAMLFGQFSRRGMGKRIVLGAAIIIAVEASFMSMNGIIAKHYWMAFALYFIPLIPIPIALAFINSEYLRARTSPSEQPVPLTS